MSAEMLCTCRDLVHAFGARRVLAGCDLHVAPGELVGLEGENGSGKSTLMRCLLGQLKPTSGAVAVHGRLGYCPQGELLHEAHTLAEHLALALSIYARRGRVEPSFVDWLVHRLALAPHMQTRIDRLSGGTRRKAVFLTAVMHQPRLLLLDEPYEGFDRAAYAVFWETLDTLRHCGSGVLLVTHVVADRGHCDRLYELREGRTHVAA